MAKPDVVLKCPVGSNGPFGKSAELPKNLGRGRGRNPASRRPNRGAKKSSSPPDKGADRKAAQAYERELQRREREGAKNETARQKERDRRQKAVDKAKKALDEASGNMSDVRTRCRPRSTRLRRGSKSENAAWGEEEKRLKAALRPPAGVGRHKKPPPFCGGGLGIYFSGWPVPGLVVFGALPSSFLRLNRVLSDFQARIFSASSEPFASDIR
jgi:hypothetical protein